MKAFYLAWPEAQERERSPFLRNRGLSFKSVTEQIMDNCRFIIKEEERP